MNKSQMILAAIGGTVVVGALALGYFIWDASSVKAENAETLEGGMAAAGSIVRKLPVKPNTAELDVYKTNCGSYADWRTEAEKLAARGDLVFEKTTPAAFKTVIVGEARRLADRPGSLDGKLVKPDFHFGFKDYVTGGALPPENELAKLQREWNDVSTVLKTLSECGGCDVGVTDVRMGKAKSAAVVEEDEEPKAKGRKPRKNAKKAKVAEEESTQGPAVTSFAVDFTIRPAGLVKAMNAFTTSTRFVVIENMTFVRERDEIAEKLGGDAKKAEQTPSRTGRRRRGQQTAKDEKPEETQSGMVTDPASAPLLKVTMAFSVYDFGTLEKAQAEAEGEEKSTEEEK